MEIEIYTLCDFAQNVNGKLTIVGTFDSINVANFPTESPNSFIAMRLRLANTEAGDHSIRIKCVDENGIELPQLSVTGGMTVLPNNNAPYSGVNIVLGMRPFRLERPGRLTFELYVDDEWVRAIPLIVNQTLPRLAA